MSNIYQKSIDGLINMNLIEVCDYLDELTADLKLGMITQILYDQEQESIEYLYPDYYLTWLKGVM